MARIGRFLFYGPIFFSLFLSGTLRPGVAVGFICDCGSYQGCRRKGIITLYFHMLAENRGVPFFRIFDGFEARRRWVSRQRRHHCLCPVALTFRFPPSLWFCEKRKMAEGNFGIADTGCDNRSSGAPTTDSLVTDSPVRPADQTMLTSGISRPAIQAAGGYTQTCISALPSRQNP